MTTLAIIGAGIAGRSLLYSLAKEGKSYSEVHLFHSDSFASPCSLNSTAVVAPRGLSAGLSNLGDMLIDGFKTFSNHVKNDSPYGVKHITQSTGCYQDLEKFKERYPHGKNQKRLGSLSFLKETYLAQEDGYLIDSSVYLGWLLLEAERKFPLKIHQNFVTEVLPGSKVILKTNEGETVEVDQVVFATGAYSKFWKNLFPKSKLESTKTVQGTYLEYLGIDWDIPSFSLTLEGKNLIYHQDKGKLLVGSTSEETHHELPPLEELKNLHHELSSYLELELPDFSQGQIKVGLREKAPKREPYVLQNENIWAIGGFYKNGFSLALSEARKIKL